LSATPAFMPASLIFAHSPALSSATNHQRAPPLRRVMASRRGEERGD
jgi:hypothetical protein